VQMFPSARMSLSLKVVMRVFLQLDLPPAVRR
jgi:hypothetical protein